MSNTEMPQSSENFQFRLPVDELVHGIANNHVFDNEPPTIFSREERERLKHVRNSIHVDKRFSDVTEEHKKLLFACWLIKHDKLKN